jgi:hypothetical protein
MFLVRCPERYLYCRSPGPEQSPAATAQCPALEPLPKWLQGRPSVSDGARLPSAPRRTKARELLRVFPCVCASQDAYPRLDACRTGANDVASQRPAIRVPFRNTPRRSVPSGQLCPDPWALMRSPSPRNKERIARPHGHQALGEGLSLCPPYSPLQWRRACQQLGSSEVLERTSAPKARRHRLADWY